MIAELPAGLGARHPREEDHPRLLAVLDAWWGGPEGEAGPKERALLLPRLYLQHFTTTPLLVERDGRELAAFLVGFLSQTRPDTAYVHFHEWLRHQINGRYGSLIRGYAIELEAKDRGVPPMDLFFALLDKFRAETLR